MIAQVLVWFVTMSYQHQRPLKTKNVKSVYAAVCELSKSLIALGWKTTRIYTKVCPFTQPNSDLRPLLFSDIVQDEKCSFNVAQNDDSQSHIEAEEAKQK